MVSNGGAWMQSTAQNWVVLTQLTDNDAAAVGITMALQFGPPLLLVSVTGWVADRFERRRLLMLTQSILLMLAIALGVLLLVGAMTLPLMYAFALALGVVMAFDNPARQTFVTDLVSRENASNAVALNAASFNGARLIGPAVAGVMIVAIGTGWVFLVNAGTFLATVMALLLIRPSELVPRAVSHAGTRLADGFRYVRRRPDLVIVFVMVLLVGAFGMNFPIFASTMALEFGQGADGFGLLSSILAIGSVVGALLAARRDRARLRVVVLATLGFALASATSVLMPTYWTYAATQVLVGLSIVTMLTTANGYVQTTTDPSLRGRVMALYRSTLRDPGRLRRGARRLRHRRDLAPRLRSAAPPSHAPLRSRDGPDTAHLGRDGGEPDTGLTHSASPSIRTRRVDRALSSAFTVPGRRDFVIVLRESSPRKGDGHAAR
jgi:MFS family permease